MTAPVSNPATESAPNGADEPLPLTGREMLGALLLTLLGAALRFANAGSLAIEHFDEGVYASNFYFGPQENFQFPNRWLYAPPLLPSLIDWLFTLVAPGNVIAILPSLLAGILTVPTVWWAGRSWFSPLAGLTAAGLASLSDVHILLSRTALTDPLLMFWLIWSAYFMERVLSRRSIWDVLFAAAFTAAGWWTKYNGWLPLAMGCAAWGLGLLTADGRQACLRSGARLAAAMGLAVVLWTPALSELQPTGGYAAVAANHRGYIVGWSGWLNSAIEQQRSALLVTSPVGLLVPVLGILPLLWFAQSSQPRFTWKWGPVVRTVPCAGTAILLCVVGAFWGAALLLISAATTGPWRAIRQSAGRMILVWVLGLAIATPLYTPYPRLVLPLLAGLWLLSGAVGGVVVEHSEKWLREPTSRKALHWVLGVGVTAGCVFAAWPIVTLVRPVSFPAWQPRDGIAQVAPQILAAIKHDLAVKDARLMDQAAIYVFGEPAAFFQLRLAGAELAVPVEHLRFAIPGAEPPRLPTYVLFGPHSVSTPGFLDVFRAAEPRLQVVGKWDVALSATACLDDRPVRAIEPGATRREVFTLYRVR